MADWCMGIHQTVVNLQHSWWRHDIETLSALLALCEENLQVTCEFPHKGPLLQSFLCRKPEQLVSPVHILQMIWDTLTMAYGKLSDWGQIQYTKWRLRRQGKRFRQDITFIVLWFTMSWVTRKNEICLHFILPQNWHVWLSSEDIAQSRFFKKWIIKIHVPFLSPVARYGMSYIWGRKFWYVIGLTNYAISCGFGVLCNKDRPHKDP